MSAAPAIIRVERRSLIRPHRDIWHYDHGKKDVRTYERGRFPTAFRAYSFPRPIRAGYRSDNSVRYGLHYGGPSGVAFTREVFLITQNWLAPVGVASIDALLVGSGGSSFSWSNDSLAFQTLPPGGGGGGAILVVLAIPVAAGFQYSMIVATGGLGNVDPSLGSVNGGPSQLRENFAPFTVLALTGQGGGAGGTGAGVSGDAQPGTANLVGAAVAGSVGGSGGGGAWFDAPPPGAGGAGAGGAGNGGNSSNNGGGAVGNTSGGGGGAGGNGSAGGAAPGNGGIGKIPPDHSFGAWGVDIGENGFFGGGGGGINCTNNFGPPVGDTVGTEGTGNGAANTGGGATPLVGGGVPSSRSGLMAIVYATP